MDPQASLQSNVGFHRSDTGFHITSERNQQLKRKDGWHVQEGKNTAVYTAGGLTLATAELSSSGWNVRASLSRSNSWEQLNLQSENDQQTTVQGKIADVQSAKARITAHKNLKECKEELIPTRLEKFANSCGIPVYDLNTNILLKEDDLKDKLSDGDLCKLLELKQDLNNLKSTLLDSIPIKDAARLKACEEHIDKLMSDVDQIINKRYGVLGTSLEGKDISTCSEISNNCKDIVDATLEEYGVDLKTFSSISESDKNLSQDDLLNTMKCAQDIKNFVDEMKRLGVRDEIISGFNRRVDRLLQKNESNLKRYFTQT